MFFVSSKLFFLLARPSAIAALLIGASAILWLLGCAGRRVRAALMLGVMLLLAFGYSPLGLIITLPLEQRFERPQPPPAIAGIILLGGYEDPIVSAGRGQLAINGRAERLTETLVLSRRYPAARIIVSGGSVRVLDGERQDAAGPVGVYLKSVGIAEDRIVLEGLSRTTHENAVFTRKLVNPKPGRPYLLVTSAVHMPRSVGTFRRQGFDIVPWPVDYRTSGAGDVMRWNDNLAEGLARVDYAFKEWVGLAAYWLADRTDALFPAQGKR